MFKIFNITLYGSFTFLLIAQNISSSFSQLIKETNLTDSYEKFLVYDSHKKKTDCYLQTPQTNSTWRLVWEDQFDDDSPFSSNMTSNWNIQNEITECTGNGLKPVTNCNLAKNVFQSHGLLVLTSKYEKYKNYNFTGSTVTTSRNFNYGRFEIRAAQPVGDEIRTRIITRDTMRRFELDNGLGQINLGSNTMDTVLYRDVSSDKFYEPANLNLFDIKEDKDLNEFHVYGMEWSEEEVVFFFDQIYSAQIKFNASIGLQPLHQIQLQIGVSGRDFYRTDGLDNFEDLNWKCPAFLIDYIRVYEQVAVIPENSDLCDTNSTAHKPSKEIVNQICKIALEGNSVPFWDRITNNWRYILIGVGIILINLLVIYHIYIVVKMKREITQDSFGFSEPSKSEANRDTELYEKYIYDKLYEHDPHKRDSYLKLYNVKNKSTTNEDHESDYVPITGSIENIKESQQQYGKRDIDKIEQINKYEIIKISSKSNLQFASNFDKRKDEERDKNQEEEIIDEQEYKKYEPLCQFKCVPKKKKLENSRKTEENDDKKYEILFAN